MDPPTNNLFHSYIVLQLINLFYLYYATNAVVWFTVIKNQLNSSSSSVFVGQSKEDPF